MTKSILAAGTLFQISDGANNTAVADVQTGTWSAPPTAGTAPIAYNGAQTAPQTLSTLTGAQLATALNALSNVTNKGGSFTGAGAAGGPYVMTAATGFATVGSLPLLALGTPVVGLLPSGATLTFVHSTPGVAAGPGWTSIAELTELPFPAPKRNSIKATNFDSPSLTDEFLGGFINPGDVKIGANWISDVSQDYKTGLLSKFAGGVTYNFRIVIPDKYPTTGGYVPGVTITFSGFFTEVMLVGTKPEDIVQLNGTLQVTGAVVYQITNP